MTTVYLHVGMPKCASSTVQGYFNKNDKLHREAGFVYPIAGRSTSGYFNHEPIVHKNPDQIAAFVSRIKEEGKDADTIFISAEAFVNAYWDQPVTVNLIEQLNTTFGASNVRLMFLMRNHFPFVESAFAQFVKGGLYRVKHAEFYEETDGTIAEFCTSIRDSDGFDFFNYSRVVQEFRKICDPKNQFEIYSIERDDLETGDILRELCEKFSLTPPPDKKIKNARFPVKALLGLVEGIKQYGFNKVRKVRKGVAKHFEDADDGFSPMFHIHGDLADTVAERQRADAEYFKNELGLDFPALFAPRTQPLFSEEAADEIRLTKTDQTWLDGYFSASFR